MLRATLHRFIAKDAGLLPLRVAKDLLRRANRTLGEPLADRETLDARDLAKARLADLRAKSGSVSRTQLEAPLLVYYEKDRNVRELERIRELLAAEHLPCKELEIGSDEATLDFVCRTARCERDHLPVVFVGPTPIGAYPELVKWNVSGALKRAVGGR